MSVRMREIALVLLMGLRLMLPSLHFFSSPLPLFFFSRSSSTVSDDDEPEASPIIFSSNFQKQVCALTEYINNSDCEGIFLTGTSPEGHDMARVSHMVQARTNLQRMDLDCE